MEIRYLEALPAAAELVVIGGGVVGCATAFFAARAGLRPLLLEQRPRLATLTTPVSTGAFRLQFDNLEELALVRRSVEVFLHFAEVTGQDRYSLQVRPQGYLFVTTTQEGVERQRRLVSNLHAWSQSDVELLSGDEARYRFPFLATEVRQARFRAGDGFLDPRALAMGLATGAGVETLTGCTVTGFRERGGRLVAVQTDRGEVATEQAVLAAGPFLGMVARLAGVELPVEAVRRQKVVMPDVPEVPPGAPMLIDDDTGAHWRPAFRGAYLLFTDPHTPPSPPHEDVPLDHHFTFALLDPASPVAVARTAPFWRQVWGRNVAQTLLQAGQYTMTPDHRPLIGATPLEGLYAHGGYSGHGIMASTAGSRLLAEFLTGARQENDNPFRLDRAFIERERDIL